MGKQSKRERQKINKALREEEQKRIESRKKTFKLVKTIGLILIIPIVIAVTIVINNITNPDVYVAKITVSIEGEELPDNGIMEIELDHAYSPNSVDHFVRFASNHLYDGLSFHRVVSDFVIQGGDPQGDGSGSLGIKTEVETPRNGYQPGDVAWAKAQNEPAGTAGSQFFIITGSEDSQGLEALNTKVEQVDGSEDYEYGYLGKVTSGLEVAQHIEGLAPQEDSEQSQAHDGPPSKEVIIQSIEIYKNGNKMGPGEVLPSTTIGTQPQDGIGEIGSSDITELDEVINEENDQNTQDQDS